MKKNNCKICHSLTDLRCHIYEVAMVLDCIEGDYKKHFNAISEWLKLASSLENVEVNLGFHERSTMFWCEPALDAMDRDAKYLSSYTTVFTRLFFLCNALEETYRYASIFYREEMNTVYKNDVRDSSLKALFVFETIDDSLLPSHFHHYNQNMIVLFERYINKYNKELNNKCDYPKNHKCYALNIIRNLRNDISHGVVPININPETNISYDNWKDLNFLLQRASHTILFYIQAFISKFNEEFDFEMYMDHIGYEHWVAMNPDEGFNSMYADKEPCTVNLKSILANIHLKGSFGYYKFYDPWN